ncbi:hypothetical protein K8I61_06915 [bacterium]|nr:hypothetical protein [bacterium]
MKTLVLARYAFLRLLRSQYFYVLFALAFFTGWAGLATGQDATTDVSLRQAIDFGVRVARTGLWLCAVWVGVTLLSGEIVTQTARTVLTKPASRLSASIGFAIGGIAFIALLAVVLAVELVIVAKIRDIPAGLDLVGLFLSFLPPLAAILALAQLASLVTPRPLAAFVAVALSYESFWRMFAAASETQIESRVLASIVSNALRFVYLLCPTYGRFIATYRDFAVMDFPLAGYAFHALAALAYAAGAAALAAVVLSRKEI